MTKPKEDTGAVEEATLHEMAARVKPVLGQVLRLRESLAIVDSIEVFETAIS